MLFHVLNKSLISLKEDFRKEEIKAEFGLCHSDPCLAVFYNWNL